MNNRDAQTLIEYLPKGKLTKWEREFIDSLSHWFRQRRPLTEKQQKALQGIYDRTTGGGQQVQRQYI